MNKQSVLRTGTGQFANQDRVAELLKQAGNIEDVYQKLLKAREGIKDELKILMPQRGVEKLLSARVVVTCSKRKRTGVKAALAKQYLSPTELAECSYETIYWECKIESV